MAATVGFIGLGNMPMFLANISQEVYQMARAAGLNKEEGSAIVKVLERLAGVHVGAPDSARHRRLG